MLGTIIIGREWQDMVIIFVYGNGTKEMLN
jgi:hypothetical protein